MQAVSRCNQTKGVAWRENSSLAGKEGRCRHLCTKPKIAAHRRGPLLRALAGATGLRARGLRVLLPPPLVHQLLALSLERLALALRARHAARVVAGEPLRHAAAAAAAAGPSTVLRAFAHILHSPSL